MASTEFIFLSIVSHHRSSHSDGTVCYAECPAWDLVRRVIEPGIDFMASKEPHNQALLPPFQLSIYERFSIYFYLVFFFSKIIKIILLDILMLIFKKKYKIHLIHFN